MTSQKPFLGSQCDACVPPIKSSLKLLQNAARKVVDFKSGGLYEKEANKSDPEHHNMEKCCSQIIIIISYYFRMYHKNLFNTLGFRGLNLSPIDS